MTAIEREYQVILDRRADRQEWSYTCYLFDQGIDKNFEESRRGMHRDGHCRQE